jgi:hypothetical protein
MGGEILCIQLPPILALYIPVDFLEGIMRELVMFWRRDIIKVLPQFDDFMFMKHGFRQCARLARRVEGDFIRAGLKINVSKCNTIPAQQRRQLGFDVDFADVMFRVPPDRCDALKLAVDSILSAQHGKVQARRRRKRLMSSFFGKVCPASDLRDPFNRQQAGLRFTWLRMPPTTDGGAHSTRCPGVCPRIFLS